MATAEPADRLPLLEFRDVSKTYDSGEERIRAVDGVSLTIHAGEVVALYGPSGSGKSTLLRIAAAVEPPDAGAVLVDGQDVTRLSPKAASAYRMYSLGWVHQEANLDEGATALENAAIKHLVATRSIRQGHRLMIPLMEELGLGHRLHQQAETLSAGERQRVVIAQALSLKPRVLLADEPTGNLNSKLGREVLQLLKEQTERRRMATLIVTHDEHAAAVADQVYNMQDGVVRAFDPETAPQPWA
jgi:putative ABC transport system ATP-binding protein